MTGPEHYAEAERLLTIAAGAPQVVYAETLGGEETVPQLLQRAAVHAWLAQVAATALSSESSDEQWAQVIAP